MSNTDTLPNFLFLVKLTSLNLSYLDFQFL